jgi:hypothetical protein
MASIHIFTVATAALSTLHRLRCCMRCCWQRFQRPWEAPVAVDDCCHALRLVCVVHHMDGSWGSALHSKGSSRQVCKGSASVRRQSVVISTTDMTEYPTPDAGD